MSCISRLLGGSKVNKMEKKPDWVTQSRDEVAKEEIYAASIHYTYMELVAHDPATWEIYGSYQWHECWYWAHMMAAWYTSPEYCKKIGIA